jgi:penicillin-binding protein 1A
MEFLYFEKNEILEAYLNQVYFGNHCYGIDAAARYYFGKRAIHLNLYESALLVGSLSAPNRYNVQDHPKAAGQRARLVLKKMVELGHIGPDDAARAIKMGWQRGIKVLRDTDFRYFLDWIRPQILEHSGDAEGDITVVTTIVPEAQVYAKLAVGNMLARKRLRGCQGALLAVKPDGAVIAMVGGKDYAKSQFNRTVQAKRQIGSLMKPIVYLAALESGWTLEDRVSDRPVKDGWPRNWDGVHKDSVTLLEALTTSRNAAAVRLAEKIGRKNVIALVRRLGIGCPLVDQPSLALGVNECSMIEIIKCYSIFARNGKNAEPYGILFIRDEKGKILYERSEENEKRLIKKKDAEKLNKMLSGVVSPSGTGHRADFSDEKLFGKTGTTQDNHDAWFVGYSDKAVACVWVGKDDSSPMQRVSGSGTPAVAWKEFMDSLHRYINFDLW